MRLFQLKNVVRDVASINFEGCDTNAIFEERQIELLSGRNLSWNRTNGSIIGDCPFYSGAFPIFDTLKLGDVLQSTGVETTTFDVEGRKYTAVAAPRLSNEAINRELSELLTFNSGEIMTVKRYVFKSELNYPPIFTPSEFDWFTFCNIQVAQRLLKCQFSQLTFRECQVK